MEGWACEVLIFFAGESHASNVWWLPVPGCQLHPYLCSLREPQALSLLAHILRRSVSPKEKTDFRLKEFETSQTLLSMLDLTRKGNCWVTVCCCKHPKRMECSVLMQQTLHAQLVYCVLRHTRKCGARSGGDRNYTAVLHLCVASGSILCLSHFFHSGKQGVCPHTFIKWIQS